MNEATGELNITVIVVIIIAVLSAFFFTIIMPLIRQNMVVETRCSDSICDKDTLNSDGSVKCKYYNDKGNLRDSHGNYYEMQCIWKG